MPRLCAYHGCGRALSRKNKSGVCPMHVHTSACRCVRCAPEVKPERPARHGVKTVVMPNMAGCYSWNWTCQTVTLPLAPWERT